MTAMRGSKVNPVEDGPGTDVLPSTAPAQDGMQDPRAHVNLEVSCDGHFSRSSLGVDNDRFPRSSLGVDNDRFPRSSLGVDNDRFSRSSLGVDRSSRSSLGVSNDRLRTSGSRRSTARGAVAAVQAVGVMQRPRGASQPGESSRNSMSLVADAEARSSAPSALFRPSYQHSETTHSMFGGLGLFKGNISPVATADNHGARQSRVAAAQRKASVFNGSMKDEIRHSTQSMKAFMSDMVFFSEMVGAMKTDNSRLSQLTDFEEGHSLRGAPWHTVLKGCGGVLANSGGSAATYDLSSDVDNIDVFISHNWSTPRGVKFLSLALYFNWVIALKMASLVSSVVCVLTVLGYLPTFPMRYGPERNERNHEEGPCCLLACFLTIWFTVFFWHETAGRMCRRGWSVFLDKLCIHQTDQDLKMRGIRSLAAYLHGSTTMVVIYSDLYFTKLWTVYELASFLLLHPAGDMAILPIRIMMYVAGLAFCFVFYRLAGYALFVADVQDALGLSDDALAVLVPIVCVCATMPACRAVRVVLQHQDELHKRVADFNLRDVTCFDEEDRPNVYFNIAQLMRHKFFRETEEVTKEVALETFNHVARQELPKVLRRSFDHGVIRYRFILLIFFPHIGGKMDVLAGHIINGAGPEASVHLLSGVVWTVAVWPLLLATLCAMCRFMIHIRDKRAWLINGVNSLLFVLLTALIWHVDVIGVQMSMRYPVAFAVYIVAAVLCGFMALIVYHRRIRIEDLYTTVTCKPEGEPDELEVDIATGAGLEIVGGSEALPHAARLPEALAHNHVVDQETRLSNTIYGLPAGQPSSDDKQPAPSPERQSAASFKEVRTNDSYSLAGSEDGSVYSADLD